MLCSRYPEMITCGGYYCFTISMWYIDQYNGRANDKVAITEENEK